MKSISFIGLVILGVLSDTYTQAQIKHAKTETVKISGNSPSVKTVIEREGGERKVAKVDWNQATKMATITYDASKTDADDVLKRIALAGFDNERFLAPDDAYANLPKEEQYLRVFKPASTQHGQHSGHSMQSTASHSGHAEKTEAVFTVVQRTTMSQLASHYFALKDGLVKTDAQTAAAQALNLQQAVKAVDMNKLSREEHTVWMKVMNSLAADAAAIAKTKDVAKQRMAFATLSQAMYQLLKVSHLQAPVYYQHCPMFNDGKGGNWLSKEKAVKNPFFGSQMMSCGSTVETLN